MRPLEAYQRLPRSVKRVGAAGLLTVGGTLGFAATAQAHETATPPDRPTAIVKVHDAQFSRTTDQFKQDTRATKKVQTTQSRSFTVVETHTRANKLVETGKSESGYAVVKAQKNVDTHPVVDTRAKQVEVKEKVETSEKVVKTKQHTKSKSGSVDKTGYSKTDRSREEVSVKKKLVDVHVEPVVRQQPQEQHQNWQQKQNNNEDCPPEQPKKEDCPPEEQKTQKEYPNEQKVFVHNTYINNKTIINNTKTIKVYNETHYHNAPVKKVHTYKKYQAPRVYKPVKKDCPPTQVVYREAKHVSAPRPVVRYTPAPEKTPCPPLKYVEKKVLVPEGITPLEKQAQQVLDAKMQVLGMKNADLVPTFTDPQLKEAALKAENNAYFTTGALATGKTLEQTLDEGDRTRAERLLITGLGTYDATINKGTEYEILKPEVQQLLRTINAMDIQTLLELKKNIPPEQFKQIFRIWAVDHRPEGLDEKVIEDSNRAALEAMSQYMGARTFDSIPQVVKDELKKIDSMADDAAKNEYIRANIASTKLLFS